MNRRGRYVPYEHELHCAAGEVVRVDARVGTIHLDYDQPLGRQTVTHQISNHPTRELLIDWMIDRIPSISSSTINHFILASNAFIDSLVARGGQGVRPEDYSSFLDWLRSETTWKESTRRTYAGYICDYYSWLLEEFDRFTLQDLDAVNARYSSAFRGFNRRQYQQLSVGIGAISTDELVQLYRAVQALLEDVEYLLQADRDLHPQQHPAFPLLPFVLLMGLLHGMRPGEINELTLADFTAVPGHVFVHQRNKEPAYLRLDPELERAWNVARKWQLRFRAEEMLNPSSPALMFQTGTRNPQFAGRMLALNSSSLQRVLTAFYRAAFRLLGENGDPLLFMWNSTKSERIPFSLPFRFYRHVAISQFARIEPDLNRIRVFARHKYSTTTTQYLRFTSDELLDKSIAVMKSISARVALRLKPKPATPDQTMQAATLGALVPGGVCDEVLQGVRSCRRAIDCRLCKHFLIDVTKRQWFRDDAQRMLRKARDLEGAAGFAREAQNARQIAALNEAIVRAIDAWTAEGELRAY